MPKHINNLPTSKNDGVSTTVEISERDRLVIDNYLETFNKSRSVMDVMPEMKHQSQANHLFNAIWDKKEVQAYVKERRNYITTQRPGLTVYEVAQELQNQMFGDITQILDCKSTEDLRDLPAETRRLIQNCKITKRTEKDRAGNVVIIEDFDYKFVDKQSAQKEYAKITGMHAIDNQQKQSTFDASKLPVEIQMALLKYHEENKPK
tara:strand:+ start:2668 stop:3285 length:618 start_codon:yes stop_codon:yes gene_type:complete